ncbi:Fic family protein [uncultured Sphaerochaeta sp.]|uniref:Fic family protein n=1 Tax=uncultured Sphaerochaeta sp. TaxID=886478 RepID=UPI002AA81458|nr:Fic family protein [uncultured Sphaerochaeta sp.]
MPSQSIYHIAVLLWKSFLIQYPTSLNQHLENFKVLFAYHSAKIENDAISYKDMHEIFHNNKVISFTGDTRTLFEQQNQKTCYEFLLPKICGKEPITLALVKEIHEILTAGTYDERRYIENKERPGEFKKHDYVTGLLEVGSSPEDVPHDIAFLLTEIQDLSERTLPPETILKAATYFHARFEYIHPFADGNGRVGRTLLNYFLMGNDHPPLIVYEEDRSLYFEVLRSYDRQEDLEPLYTFFLSAVEKTWEKKVERSLGDNEKGERSKLEDLL